MTKIKATVREGRIEVDEPINLPDGTELLIPIPESVGPIGFRVDDHPETPDGIDAWIHWYDALEPFELTDAERAAWNGALDLDKQFELTQWENHSKRVEEHFR